MLAQEQPFPHRSLQGAALQAKAWPFEQARRILERAHHTLPKKGYILLETGYGPSGLPHIGTFGEVARTSIIRHVLEVLSDSPVKLFSFSDDMDGLRKVPDNVPNSDLLAQHLGKPLTQIPDPYDQYESFGHHNNAMLQRFLDSFGFKYEFQSATDWYKSGRFDPILRLVLEHYEAVMAVILPTLRQERQQTYSPFLPICKRTGRILQVPILQRNVEAGTLIYRDEEINQLVEVPITGGQCKLQWKVDWAMRWRAFDVDYEMSGKDLIDSVKLSSQICRIIGGTPPEGFTYELFLDENGEKISKSKGNGLTIDEWLTYAPTESLAYYMFQSPNKAKRLYFDVIPRAVDDYITALAKLPHQRIEEQLENPVWHIHEGNPPKGEEGTLTFGLLLNLASVCNSEDPTIIWGFISRYQATATPDSLPFLDRLVRHAIAYYRDFIKPHKRYREPTSLEKVALDDLRQVLMALPSEEKADPQAIQTQVYEVGKRHPYGDLRSWFATLYEVLLGQQEGPRLGSFIALYGAKETCQLIEEKIRAR